MNETLIQVRQATRKNIVFHQIRNMNEQLSRFDICKMTKYSTTTVKAIVDELITEGLVIEVESKDSRVGRRPSILSVNREASHFMGIECSSAAINFTVINAAQEIIYHTSSLLKDPVTEDILLTMEQVLGSFSIQRPEIWESSGTISFSLPGKINAEKGIGIRYGNVPGWKDIDFRSRFGKYGKEMCFTHNVDAMLCGYRIQQNIPADKAVLFLVIRNSVGARLFANGSLLSGFGITSEIAHIRANDSGRRCSCGKRGCFDTEVSVRAIQNKLHEACNAGLMERSLIDPEGKGIDIDRFLSLAVSGNPVAYDIFTETVEYIAEMMEVLFSFFKPDIVVLSSFLCAHPPIFQEQLEKRLQGIYDAGDLPDFEYILSADELSSFGAAVAGYDNRFSVNAAEI